MGRGEAEPVAIDPDDVQRTGLDSYDEKALAADQLRWQRVFDKLSVQLDMREAITDRLVPLAEPALWKALSEAGSDKTTDSFYEDLIGYLHGDVSSGSYGPLAEVYELVGLAEDSQEFALADMKAFRGRLRPWLEQVLREERRQHGKAAFSSETRFKQFRQELRSQVWQQALPSAVERLYQLAPEDRLRRICHLADEEATGWSESSYQLAYDDAWRAFEAAYEGRSQGAFAAGKLNWPTEEALYQALLEPVAARGVDGECPLLLLATAMEVIEASSMASFQKIRPEHQRRYTHQKMIDWWSRSGVAI